MEQLVNHLAVSALSGPITDSDTILPVVDLSGFPSTGDFRIRVEDELMLVTDVTAVSTSFTVQRGIEGTIAAPHISGVLVKGILTAGSLLAFISRWGGGGTLTGAAASRTTLHKAGVIYVPTDSAVVTVDNGTGWNSFGRLHPFTPPVLAEFSPTNINSAVYNGNNGMLHLWCDQFTGDSWRILDKATPTYPFCVTVAAIPVAHNVNYNRVGWVVRDSVSGKFYTLANNLGTSLYLWNWNSPTSYAGGTLFGANCYNNGVLTWFRYKEDYLSKYFQLSFDGIHFQTLYSAIRTEFLTANRVGIGVNDYSNNGWGRPWITVFSHETQTPTTNPTLIPSLARSVQLKLTFTRSSGTTLDGYIDNLTFKVGSSANLVVNGDAEGNNTTGWTVSSGSGMSVVSYGTAGYPAVAPSGGGTYFFYGGSQASTVVYQNIDLSPYSSSIDAGSQPFTLSAYLGGYSTDADNVQIDAIFKTSGGAILNTTTIPGITAAQRANATNMFFVQALSF